MNAGMETAPESDGSVPAGSSRSRRERERELARLSALGGRDAFRELVDVYKDRMAQFVRWYAGLDEDAEDAVSEIFLEAYRSIGKYRGEATFGTWLYSLARNVCRHRLRRQRRRQDHETPLFAGREGESDVPDGRLDHEDLLQTEESRRLVREAVDALPSASRSVLHLREWEELSYEEIAGVLEIPVGTVRSRLHNATTSLMRRLSPHFGRSTEGGVP